MALTSAERCKRYRDKMRSALIESLGGKCAKCGATEALEFDHPWRRTWVARNVYCAQRLRIYQQEAAQGLLRLLCSKCNKLYWSEYARQSDPFYTDPF